MQWSSGYIDVTGITNFENSADAPAGYYQHTSFLQDELKALDGKLVELVCPVYGYSGLYGWRLGTAISYQEVTE